MFVFVLMFVWIEDYFMNLDDDVYVVCNFSTINDFFFSFVAEVLLNSYQLCVQVHFPIFDY